MTARPHRLVAGLFVAAAAVGCSTSGCSALPSTPPAAATPSQPTSPPVTALGETWAVVVPTGGDDTAQLQAAVDRFDRIIIIGTLHVAGTVRITRPVEIRWRAR